MTLAERARSAAQRAALGVFPDLPASWMDGLAHAALVFAGAEQWTAVLAGFRVQRYAVAGRGEGPPVLLLHGLNGSVSNMVMLVPELRRKVGRVVLLDLPAHGRSPAVDVAPSLFDHASVVQAAVQELWRETGMPVVLVGNSMGGALSLLVAAELPEQVAAVALLNPAGAPRADEAVGRLPESFPDPLEGARTMAGMLFARTPPLFWLIARDIARGWTSPTVQRVLGDARHGRHRMFSERLLSRLRAPVLVLWGAEDRMLPRESLESFGLIPGASIEVIPGCGHMPQVERPRLVGRQLRRFIGSLGRAAAARG